MMDAVTLLQLDHFLNHSFLSGKSYNPSHRSGLVGLFIGSVQGPIFLQSPFNFSGDYDKQKNEINGRSWWRKGDFGIWFDGDKNCESDWIIGSISKWVLSMSNKLWIIMMSHTVIQNLSLGSRKGYIFSGPNRSNSKCQPTKCPILDKPKWKTAKDTRFSPG